ncbi:two-component regulator propeller domain-containing protein [Seonamhaeicola sp.]|uniref:two-component regulator propeller domain-containing protein n=1 Tax=Seonamhaeicola sp. TaxID=1912245 RepID=UPI00260E9BF8|nr:two-component regulator propeller domain-containing protein [Seonamhaeicola sp.]
MIHGKCFCNLFLFAFLCVAVHFCYAQTNFNFERITTSEGLSQNDINCIYQDDEGFMWFGTFDGLNKYDGYKFINYVPNPNNPESISSNIVFTITGDKKGNLWVGTTGGGLNRYNKVTDKFTRFNHDPNDGSSIDSDFIRGVFVDNLDRLWVSTDKGLNMWTNSSTGKPTFKHYPAPDGMPLKNIYQDSKGTIWTVGSNKLYQVKETKNGSFRLRRVLYNNDVHNSGISYIGEDNKGNLLIGTSNGLYEKSLKYKKRNAKRISGTPTKRLVIDDEGQYWIGGNNGLFQFIYNEKNRTLVKTNHFTYNPVDPNSISKDVVKALYKDKTGIIWIGSNGGGVNKVNPKKKQFLHIKNTLNPNSLSYDKIRSFFEDSYGNLWVGTEGGGLNVLLHSESNDFNKFKKFESVNKVFALEEIKHKNRKKLVIGDGSRRGLFMLDIEKALKNIDTPVERLMETSNSVFSILHDTDGNLWIGTYGGGIYRLIANESGDFDITIFKHDEQNPNSVSGDIIREIYQDSKGNIWFGTGDGLSRLDYGELLEDDPMFDVFKTVPEDETSISHNYIMPIYEHSSGDIYIGTFGGGLNKFVPSRNGMDEKFVRYIQKDGLPNNVVKSILEDHLGNIWVSTNKGLSKFDPESETFKNYDVNDGLQDNEFQELAGLKRRNGELLFGGINGFNVFTPSEINDNILPSETVISSFSIFNEKVEVGEAYGKTVLLDSAISYTKNIDLKHHQNSFTIEFTGLHYEAPLKNKFSYILEGYDKDWMLSTSNSRFANYTNISPGNYTFKVKSSNSDGIWDATPSELNLYIAPPFWKTNVAYFLYTLLAIGLLLAFRKYTIIGTTRKHQLELEHLEKEQKEELQRVKLEFFTNISHEFRTPLTLIKGPLDYLMGAKSTQDNEEVREQCQIMLKNTNYLLRLVNQLLDFRKINQGKMRLVIRHTNIVNFIKDIGEPFQFIAHKQDIDFSIKSPHQSIKAWFDHDALEKVIKNLLSNAFKFTPRGGEVEIHITKETKPNVEVSDYVVIKVKNTGRGIDQDEIESIFNRFYTKKDKHKNSNFQSGAGIGLAFTKNLINFHRGTIEVESEPNESTTFIVNLPQKKTAYEAIPEISIKEKTESDFHVRSSEQESYAIHLNDELEDSEISNSRSKLPVLLVVDDNKDIRNFIRKALGESYRIVEASNGAEGLELANEIIPNIVLTDVIMPVMDGIELCNELKNKNETSHIPVIMLTAKSSSESEIEGLKIGADGYIKKPFDINILKLKLSNILKYREGLKKKFNREITLQPEEVTVTSLDEKFLKRAIEIVEKHMMNTDFNVELLVKEMGLSRSNLYVKFKELTGLSSSAFIRNIRLKRAVQLLEQSNFSVKEIMYMTGFNTSSYFSQCFKKQFGMLPRDYVKKIKAEKAKSIESAE